jgi:hypothetical protein
LELEAKIEEMRTNHAKERDEMVAQ